MPDAAGYRTAAETHTHDVDIIDLANRWTAIRVGLAATDHPSLDLLHLIDDTIDALAGLS